MTSISMTFLATAILVPTTICVPGETRAGDSDQVVSAMKSGLESDADFKTVHEFITSSNDEEKWRAIPWIPGLWTGVQAAAKSKRPLFVWAMNGDPLGCV